LTTQLRPFREATGAASLQKPPCLVLLLVVEFYFEVSGMNGQEAGAQWGTRDVPNIQETAS